MMTSKVEVDEKTEKQIPDLIQVKAAQLPDVQIIHNQDNDPAPDDSYDYAEQNSPFMFTFIINEILGML